MDFDPQQISYGQLLDMFWASHNPHSGIYSQQYKAVVFYSSEEQRQLAEAAKQQVEAETGLPVNTEILPLGQTRFYLAEDYHQKYYLRHNAVLMQELHEIYGSEREFTDSTLAARLNSYVAGHGYSSVVERELPDYGLRDDASSLVSDLAAQLDEGESSGAFCGLAN